MLKPDRSCWRDLFRAMPGRRPPARPTPSLLGRVRRLLLPACLGLAGAAALAAAPRDRLTLLVPDAAAASAWQIKVWTDSAAEEGLRIDMITDSALLALDNTAAANIAGLIVPDSAHQRASDALVAAIKQYAFTGGHLMLVYDAGTLTDGGYFPLAGSSRFADMVGVDYVLWNGGLGANTMVGFGQVVGTQARLDALSLPPGKYQPYVAPASLAQATLTTAFVPTSALDPGAGQLMAPLVLARAQQGIDEGSANVRRGRPLSLHGLLGLAAEGSGLLRFERRNLQASRARDMHLFDRVARAPDAVAAVLSVNTTTATATATERSALAPAAAAALVAADSTLQAISGYAFGPLSYYAYVTTGSFPGTVYLSSPEHGLVAGHRSWGSGQVLFVNLPLGYFKAIGSDAAPLHGFLGQFAREQVGIASLSVQPRARGGLVYNWHVDDGNDLTADTKSLLANTQVLHRGPFSIHFTAGPDVVRVGDRRGMNLPGSAAAQSLVKRLGNIGPIPAGTGVGRLAAHELGSHGGWIHDFWGAYATEANVPDLTSLLTQNFDAIERVTGRKIREYSSPQGNTPAWAVSWLEARGVVAMYLVGDVGAGLLRSRRNGVRLADKLWSVPVTPLGPYATFEEFDEAGISDSVSGQWLLDLQSFAVNHRTNRMFYTHPPGVRAHLNPINALLTRADALAAQGSFSWYTMTELADFAQRRVAATWTTSVASSGVITFSASHPRSLADMSWLLPKARYTQPALSSGKGLIESDSLNWIVTANSGSSLRFTSSAL